MKLDIYLECDACEIRIGPKYLNRIFYDVGQYKLCSSCYSELNERGFLYLKDKKGLAEIILTDGTKTLISKEDLEQLDFYPVGVP